MTMRMLLLAALTLAPLAAASVEGSGHPIGGVITLLQKLKGEAEKEGQQEAVNFEKFEYWCKTEISDLNGKIKDENSLISELTSAISGYKATILELNGDQAKIAALRADKTNNARHVEEWVKDIQGDIPELVAEGARLSDAAANAATKDAARKQAAKTKLTNLKKTLSAVSSALARMSSAGTRTSALLQTDAAASVRSVMSLLSVEATEEQQNMLADFAGEERYIDDEEETEEVVKDTNEDTEVVDDTKEDESKDDDVEESEEYKEAMKDDIEVAEDAEGEESDDGEAKAVTKAKAVKKVKVTQAPVKAKGDHKKHEQKYAFKSDKVIELLKDLKMKFEDDIRETTADEANAANQYALEKQARSAAQAATAKSKSQKDTTLATTTDAKVEAEAKKTGQTNDKKTDTAALDKTTTACKTKTREWQERSATRTREMAALDMGVTILAKVAGVRTEPSNNPMIGAAPAFLQVEDPEARVVNLLRTTATAVHSKSLENLAREISAHKGAPFEVLNESIEKMILKVMAEQTSEDNHKAWCDLELAKTKESTDDKTDKLRDVNARISSETAKIAQIKLDTVAADKMVTDITVYMSEATEIRNAGKHENKVSEKDAQEAQAAIANAVAVLEDFYKSSSTPPALPADPSKWDSTVAGTEAAKPGTAVLSILKNVAADFITMEAKTKAQEVQDQKEYEDQMAAMKVEKNRRSQESAAKVIESKRKVEKVVALNLEKKHVTESLNAVIAYNKDLQPTCVSGDSSYADKKAARAKELASLKSSKDTLRNALRR